MTRSSKINGSSSLAEKIAPPRVSPVNGPRAFVSVSPRIVTASEGIPTLKIRVVSLPSISIISGPGPSMIRSDEITYSDVITISPLRSGANSMVSVPKPAVDPSTLVSVLAASIASPSVTAPSVASTADKLVTVITASMRLSSSVSKRLRRARAVRNSRRGRRWCRLGQEGSLIRLADDRRRMDGEPKIGLEKGMTYLDSRNLKKFHELQGICPG